MGGRQKVLSRFFPPRNDDDIADDANDDSCGVIDAVDDNDGVDGDCERGWSC